MAHRAFSTRLVRPLSFISRGPSASAYYSCTACTTPSASLRTTTTTALTSTPALGRRQMSSTAPLLKGERRRAAELKAERLAVPDGASRPAVPSACIILVTPRNKLLMVHRAAASPSFPSAHVFPGGTLHEFQDGVLPRGLDRHADAPAYRLTALRETFEEAGILLAHSLPSEPPEAGPANTRPGRALAQVDSRTLFEGRVAVTSNEVAFQDWCSPNVPDFDALIPASHWITPAVSGTRYTTQMYLSFLPELPVAFANADDDPAGTAGDDPSGTTDIQTESVPRFDGGREILAVSSGFASDWLDRAAAGRASLYPPQFVLLSVLARFLKNRGTNRSKILADRAALIRFLDQGDLGVPWGQKTISPLPEENLTPKDGSVLFRLDKPGPEIAMLQEKRAPNKNQLKFAGTKEFCLKVWFEKSKPTKMEIVDTPEKILNEISFEEANASMSKSPKTKSPQASL